MAINAYVPNAQSPLLNALGAVNSVVSIRKSLHDQSVEGDKEKGVLTPLEEIALGAQGATAVAPGTTGSIPTFRRDPNSGDLVATAYRPMPNLQRQMQMLEMQIKGLGIQKDIRDLQTPKDNQTTAAKFGAQAEQANKIITDLQKSGYDPASSTSAVLENEKLPTWISGKLASSPYVKAISPDFQEEAKNSKLYSQARDNFLLTALRDQIGPRGLTPELRAYGEKTYFPQSNDPAELVAQKNAARQGVINAEQATAGPLAWSQFHPGGVKGQATLGGKMPPPNAQNAPLTTGGQMLGKGGPDSVPDPGSAIAGPKKSQQEILNSLSGPDKSAYLHVINNPGAPESIKALAILKSKGAL